MLTRDELNHGLALSNDNNILYASSAEAVFAWAYDAKNAAVNGQPRTLIANMSNSDLVTRTLLMSQKQNGTLLVSRGSAEENTAQTQTMTSGLSQIRAFDLTKLTAFSAPYIFSTSGLVLGWGLRNSVGVGEHPVTGAIYAVENSVDGVKRNGVDVHENNPGEELNFLGYLNGTASANQGRNFGYPVCYAVWQVDEIPDNDGLAIGKQFATQENATLRDETCAQDYVPPRLTFPAHYAPIDIKFSTGGETAYVTFRGSCECFFLSINISPLLTEQCTSRPHLARGLPRRVHRLQRRHGRTGGRGRQQQRAHRPDHEPKHHRLPGQMLPARGAGVRRRGEVVDVIGLDGRDLRVAADGRVRTRQVCAARCEQWQW